MDVKIKKLSEQNIMDKQVFKYLFGKYCEELRAIDSMVELTEEDAFECFGYGNTSVYLVIVDAMTSGFFIVGQPPKNCPDCCDYYIQEFYIQNKVQNKGVGKLAMKEFLKDHVGKYFLYVLIKNTRAIHFWDKVISQNHCTKFTTTEEITNYDNTIYVMFKTQEG